MEIGILETGSLPPDLEARFGAYDAMFARMLRDADPAFSTRNFNIHERMEMPESPRVADGWIITGSRHAVYEDHLWIEPLKAFLREVHAAQVPMVGVCFGHQILAEALGGRVEKSANGWGCGIHEYTVHERTGWMDEARDRIAIQAMHQDQVVERPAGARVIASSPFCPNAGLAYGETAISIQPHPEFTADFERELILARRGTAVPEELADAALEGIDGPTDSAVFARWITAFFRQVAQRQAA